MSTANTTDVPPTQASSGSTGNTAQRKYRFLWSEELNEFLSSLDSYNPTVPEAFSAFHLQRSGVAVKDERICKLVSLAADKFISEIIHEAKQISVLRQQSVKNQKRKLEMSETLENDDLESSLAQMRIYLRRKKTKTEDL